MIPNPKTFLSTYKEWHYFLGGLSAGFALGFVFRGVLAWLRRWLNGL